MAILVGAGGDWSVNEGCSFAVFADEGLSFDGDEGSFSSDLLVCLK
jgi:hypothetical protein